MPFDDRENTFFTVITPPGDIDKVETTRIDLSHRSPHLHAESEASWAYIHDTLQPVTTNHTMKSKSKNLLCAGVMAAFTLSAPHASAVVIAQFDFDSDTENFSPTNVTGLTTSGGLLTGTPSSNDPQLINSTATPTITGSQTWDTVVFRVRETDSASGLFIGSAGAPAFSSVGLVAQVNSFVVNSGFTFVASGDDFYTVTADISGFTNSTINNIRVDPTGGALSNSGSETNGNFFEVDFIQINAVPEPSAALLGCFGLLALLRRRR